MRILSMLPAEQLLILHISNMMQTFEKLNFREKDSKHEGSI